MSQNGQAQESAHSAITPHKLPREYQKHRDCTRQRALKERGRDAIDGRTRDGKRAKAWRRWAIEQKGGEACPRGIMEKIDDATFLLWRKLHLRAWIIADTNKRGTMVNRRRGYLPKVHEQYDSISARFNEINEALDLDKIRTPNPLGDLGGLLLMDRQGDIVAPEGVNDKGRVSLERCQNPVCGIPIEPLSEGQWRRTPRRFCSDRCKIDGWALRRAAELLSGMDIIRAFEILERLQAEASDR